jgi:drug/metabolite transporter (DMT)-like permease
MDKLDPFAFGLIMATVDIGMMGLAKLTHIGKIPYLPGLLGATALYALQPFLFFKALEVEPMFAANLIWNLTSSVVITLLGVFYFGEKVNGLRLIAMLMGLFSLVLFGITDS